MKLRSKKLPLTILAAGLMTPVARIGDRVVVTGNPGRNPDDHRLRLLAVGVSICSAEPPRNSRWPCSSSDPDACNRVFH